MLAGRSLVQPVAASVEHARVPLRLARYADRRARAGENDAVGPDHLPRAERQLPAVAGGLEACHLPGDDLGIRLAVDFAQVITPLPVRWAEAAAVHPVGVHAVRDQVPRPRPPTGRLRR